MLDSFKFDLADKRTRFTDDELLAGLRRFAATRPNKPFTVAEFNTNPDRPFHAATIIHRLGSWRAALLLIGIRGVRGRSYSAEDLIANLEFVWKKLGRKPGLTHLRRRGEFSVGPYNHRWGSLRRACFMLAAYHEGKITREQLLNPPPAPRQRAHIPTSRRWQILNRDHHRCQSCGASPFQDSTIVLHVDHILPVSRGGSNEESNLQTLRSACNQGKRDHPPDPTETAPRQECDAMRCPLHSSSRLLIRAERRKPSVRTHH